MTMMRVDFWATERERAEVMPNGVRVLRSDGIQPGAKCWNPKVIKPTWSYSFRSVEERERMIAETIAKQDAINARKAQRRTEAVTGDVTLPAPVQAGATNPDGAAEGNMNRNPPSSTSKALDRSARVLAVGMR